jgi:hypothetical protein
MSRTLDSCIGTTYGSICNEKREKFLFRLLAIVLKTGSTHLTYGNVNSSGNKNPPVLLLRVFLCEKGVKSTFDSYYEKENVGSEEK